MLIFLFLVVFSVCGVKIPLHNVISGMSGPNPKGGDGCAACTVLLHFVEELADYHELSIVKSMEYICDILPSKEQKECKQFIFIFGPVIIELFEESTSIDEICLKIGICSDPTCKIYDKGYEKYIIPEYMQNHRESFTKMRRNENENPVGKWDPILEDNDGDKFSTYFCLRGSAFRGKDCNDDDDSIYPGRKSQKKTDDSVDFNCNGIYGENEKGESYMEKFCANSNPRGIAVIGDSVCSHFRVPPIWIAPNVTKEDYLYLPEWGECEMDWPFLGTYTGYMNDPSGLVPGKVSSLYQYALKKNLCMHRDYQNVCVNGARSSVLKDLVRSLSRNQENDYPLTLFVNLVGDDVCSGHPYVYTKPEEWKQRILDGLDYLDTILPSDSYVIFVGFVDGRILYDTLSQEIHPVGVTYEKVYEYLNCLNISMCWGWLNKDESVRNLTTHSAELLNAETIKIVENNKYEHFKLLYIPFNTNLLMDKIAEEGYRRKDAFEPMDGFHPSQITQHILTQYLIEETEKVFPDAFGTENEYNEEIKKIFGDQGGY